MKLKDIYGLAIQMGMDADPRGRAAAEAELQAARKAYDKLAKDEKDLFDMDSLQNPYGDSRILNGDPEAEIHKALVGIDMEIGELLLAAELNRQGMGIDLVFAHHPEGGALVNLAKVMPLQGDRLEQLGIRPAEAAGVMKTRMSAVNRSVGVNNSYRACDAARLLNLNFICLHTVCDNMVNTFLTQYLEKEALETLDDLCKALLAVPEYRASAKGNNPPRIDVGEKTGKVGKIYVDFTGGTSGPKEAYKKLAESGVNTVISMHNTEDQIKTAKEIHLNLVCAGHIASDSIGLNLFLDALEKEGLEIVPVSGLIRVKRS